MKLLVLFLDGFHPSYLEHPRATALAGLASRSSVAEMEPVLGFSSANRATLFTGTTPDVHEQWSYFQYDPDRSPFSGPGTTAFRWVDRVPGDLARKGLKFALSKTIVRRAGRARGYPNLSWENVPLRLLPHFDHTERDIVRGDVGVPSLFSIARERGLRAEWVNVPRRPGPRALARVDAALRRSDVVVAYSAAMDAAGHWFSPEPGARFDRALARTDALVARLLALAEARWPDGHEVMLVSDHGMARTTRHVNVLRLLKRIPRAGKGFVPFVDSTMARFWFEDDASRRRVEALLEGLPHGHVLSRADAKRFGVDFSHRRYGDLVFLLDPDTAFYPAFVSWVKPRGMHGYDPTHPSQTALLATTHGKSLPARVRATSVLGHALAALEARAPAGKGPASVAGALSGGTTHHDC